MDDRLSFFTDAYNELLKRGIIHKQRDLAQLTGVSEGQISRALKGDPRNLSEPLCRKVQELLDRNPKPEEHSGDIPVIPTAAMGGALGDLSEAVEAYQCDWIPSPVKGATFAVHVTGESMEPAYPHGSMVIVKRVDEAAFLQWGEAYVLDTPNGVILKRVFPTEDPAVVECRSVNPDYRPFTVRAEFVRGWYRVLLMMALR